MAGGMQTSASEHADTKTEIGIIAGETALHGWWQKKNLLHSLEVVEDKEGDSTRRRDVYYVEGGYVTSIRFKMSTPETL